MNYIRIRLILIRKLIGNSNLELFLKLEKERKEINRKINMILKK